MARPRELMKREIFVAYAWNIYPDRNAYKRVYTSLERALSVKFVFAEERITSEHLLDKIGNMIRDTTFGIYDVSGWNPNVTLEYGLARGMGALAFIAFNPDVSGAENVPTDVQGYDRLQYADFEQLSAAVATLVTQQLGREPMPTDPLEEDQQRLLELVRENPGKTAGQLAGLFGARIDYVQLLIRRSGDGLATTGATRGVRYYLRGQEPSKPRRKPTVTGDRKRTTDRVRRS